MKKITIKWQALCMITQLSHDCPENHDVLNWYTGTCSYFASTKKIMVFLLKFFDEILYHLEFHSASITMLKMEHIFSQLLSLMNLGVTVPNCWQLTQVYIHFAVAMFMKMRGEILTWEFLSRQSRSWWPQMRIRKTGTYGLCMAACPLSDEVPCPSSLSSIYS